MNLHGQNLIGYELVKGATSFRAINPATSTEMEPAFFEAGSAEVGRALELAEKAFEPFRALPAQRRAEFLKAIAAKIETDDVLVERANLETGLPLERLRGERGRTVGQLRLFAKLIEEGSWVGARIDRADANRKPIPKPDLRRMLIPIGPVVVFAASNFPLAFSAAGGDSASAFAAGCTVVLKAHPGHPGTSERVAVAVLEAARETAMPAGIFCLLHGRSHELGMALVKHPLTRAVGFTGSLRGGRAIFDAAASRPEPIPVFAEMGSTNPVFILPGALAERGKQIAVGLRGSVTLGVGQFCTNPGLIVTAADSNSKALCDELGMMISDAPPGTMLYGGLRDSYEAGSKRFASASGVRVVGKWKGAIDPGKTQVAPTLFAADVKTYLSNHDLHEELFGPATLWLSGSNDELEALAQQLDGHLTATIHGTADDLAKHHRLISILERKVGRLIFNGYPTGVEVARAMQHGGPYPATTDARTTSVGTAAIERFVRPICYQDFPPGVLPEELRDENPRKILRLVDGEWTRG
jgi:NADP-dependent aldehyde dehydrogenase